MKKLLAVLVPMALALTACVTPDGAPTQGTATATSLASTAIKVGVQAKCVNEINNNSYWKTGSRVLSATKKQELETEVCSCVGENATKNLTAADLVVAAMDRNSQATLVTKLVTSTLNACVVDTLKLK